MTKDFLVVVITSPESWDGEADCLEGMLETGLQKLHIRKQGDGSEELLQRLAPKWSKRLVLHGDEEMALRYGIPQIHGYWLDKPTSVGLSASTHSWEEVSQITPGALEYVFLSPLFDSISKPGYTAGAGLLQRPAGISPCRLIGLGGIDQHTIGQVIDHGWDGAAVLGYLWGRPDKAVERFKILKAIVENHGR